jgi:hypothetical protein
MQQFSKFIYKAIECAYDADIREGVGISQIGYCELKTQNFFIRKQRPQIPVDRLLAMRTGTATHADLFKLLFKYRGEIEGFIYKKREVEVNLPTPKGTIIGHLDLMAEVDGRLEIADLKVVDFGPFGYISEPREHEYDQIICYAAAAGIEDCRLVYLCKGGKKTTADVKEYAFKVDHDRVKVLAEKYDRIMAGEAVKPFDSPQDSWECGVCPFYEECWGKKVFIQKQSGVVEIDPALEEAYIEKKLQADAFKQEADEIKARIEAELDGKRGEGNALSAWFVGPKSYDQYDSALLKKHVDPEILKKCSKPVEKSGYYTLKIRK